MDSQITIRIPARLMDIILEIARSEDRSINKTITMLMWHGIDNFSGKKKDIPTVLEIMDRAMERLGKVGPAHEQK